MTKFTMTAFGAAGITDTDLTMVATRIAAVPVRELYGLLWSAGLLEIVE